MSLEQLREYIVVKCPRMKAAVARIPPTGKYPNDMGRTELQELKELMTFVDVRAQSTIVHTRFGLRLLGPTTRSAANLPCSSAQMPERATLFNPFPPKYVCQMFRGNKPVTTDMILSCLDPEKYKVRSPHTRAKARG